jgi:hypothetical protein
MDSSRSPDRHGEGPIRARGRRVCCGGDCAKVGCGKNGRGSAKPVPVM